MKEQQHIIVNGNQATAHVAYRLNEVCAIYPITPASEMSELLEAWSADGQENIFGGVPSIIEMQSEGGVAGAMHGALQTGSLSTTFTASQGLLLMMPNMYKIAGELTPNVIHVATRSVATHALSVFGDHSDIMAARNTGYAFLGSASVQEAMDFALIAQAATLASRIPFVHFFDGFRTSHETSRIEKINDHVIHNMINKKLIGAHKKRALNPNNPFVRGTSQGPDVFFQSREAVNPYYDACPQIVQDQMDEFAKLTGRHYRLFDYVSHPEAEQVVVAMASAAETLEETINQLNAQGEKIGLVKVRLFRPFSTKHLIQSLPDSCKAIAVLDRTKESGATGEPLYLDVLQSVVQSLGTKFNTIPKVVGGRYGLSSKEFTPSMVKAIVNNLKCGKPKNNFTVGITDDVTHTSLVINEEMQIRGKYDQALFYETKSADTPVYFNSTMRLLGSCTDAYIQGYTECDYKKSSSRSVSNLRMSEHRIKAPYLIQDADFAACDSIQFLKSDNVLQRIARGGTLLVNSELSPESFWADLPSKLRHRIQEKNVAVYLIDLKVLPTNFMVNGYTISALHACHLAIKKDFPSSLFSMELKDSLVQVDTTEDTTEAYAFIQEDEEFAKTLLGSLLAGRGNELPTSMLPVDGTYESGSSNYIVRNPKEGIPIWDTDLCTQCGACSMACPQGAMRIKAYEVDHLKDAPQRFRPIPFLEELEGMDLLNYTVQVNPEQCTSCNNCVDACPVKALVMNANPSKMEKERENWEFFSTLPEMDRTKIDATKVSQQQLQEPLFKYPMGVDGCGEAPYLRLLSQLFGDRMLVANATGASSIFGGALPTTPWSKNAAGRGPAWSNSLFEDNAEFGLGYHLSLDYQEKQAKNLLLKLVDVLDSDLVESILNASQNTEAEIFLQRQRVERLRAALSPLERPEAGALLELLDSLVKQTVWIVGGDGWAYDIGYGGLDHVLASGKNVNILVLDNEVYSNTGGQMSKATPFGASAKFAAKGKLKQKKDLGMLAMGYEDVYVASVAIGADQEQTLKAFLEAEQHDGPSIILAYCHSPAHGIDMRHPSQYHKAAVASGQWLLYRNNPNRTTVGLNTLELDSGKPTISIQDYLRMEKRFGLQFEMHQDLLEGFVQTAQKNIDDRYFRYKSLECREHSELVLQPLG
ncbi:4Fe-4S binding protein [Flagellimonas algicola]|uniref:4Fe-4S dicluster domain-containing protein n=1 Tax=Flagellimonas algicola TaxID=2583815 RepID=A0ABY2WPU2_9FLAO|nr:4Fe-4S binding protein [Allomuricauda algicola]TMU56998.1 4Fe-4S dicluster domain-containing protein [Allomuricauda algicola]